MGWKNLPPWLRGGIIGVIISLIICISLGSFLHEQIVYDGCHSREIPGEVYSQCDMIDDQLKSSSASSLYHTGFIRSYIFICIIISIPFFICGSILGLIIGKIKSKK
jgi:hypothetical protein